LSRRELTRRDFIARSAAATASVGFSLPAALGDAQNQSKSRTNEDVPNQSPVPDEMASVDFRYSPVTYQSTFCFPDDAAKSLVGEHGDLRYDFSNQKFAAVNQFGTIIEFDLAGMRRAHLQKQWLEAPGIPVVHTLLERDTATIELTTFATNRAGEGRVDNVLMEVRAKAEPVAAVPLIRIRSCTSYKLSDQPQGHNPGTTVLQAENGTPLLYCIPEQEQEEDIQWRLDEGGYLLNLQHCKATRTAPGRYFFRLPQQEQPSIDVTISPDVLLDEARAWWKQWSAFGDRAAAAEQKVEWSLPGTHGEFLIACARNIQESRVIENGRAVFQVGPTVYRSLFLVDGNFLLEAGRYLGYDKEVDQGLMAEWQRQLPSGQVAASAGTEDWKDTAIAMFTLARQCELKQDWSMFRELLPNVRRALDFLIRIRNEARKGNSLNGRYGLLPPGFADGGMAGLRDEFTNTVWTLAGLRAVVRANQKLNLPGLENAPQFYQELRSAFMAAAKKEMVRDPRGFTYLPMLLHTDPALTNPDPWLRPRPQTAQWALSQAIFPGEVFAKDDPIVLGHIALMQACTQEDVPAETGWLWHQAVWNYNAAFVAEVYLWAHRYGWAQRTFTGYLNHASPMYAWREEQPLQHSLIGDNWGDMPHNWASAECVRYLRHMLVLEDIDTLRLMDGIAAADLAPRKPFVLKNTPTKFGRINFLAEPTDGNGWRMKVHREGENAPSRIEAPSILGRARFTRIEGATQKIEDGRVVIDPAATDFTVFWE
jgi:hypothetical protein